MNESLQSVHRFFIRGRSSKPRPMDPRSRKYVLIFLYFGTALCLHAFFFYRKRHYMVLGPNRIATSLDRLIIPRAREVSRVEKSPICISLILSVVHHFVPWCPTSIVFRVPGVRPRNSVGPSRKGRAVMLCACWCLCVCWEGRGTGLTWPFTWGTRTDLSTAWTVGVTSVVSETGG